MVRCMQTIHACVFDSMYNTCPLRDGLRFTYDQWRKALLCNKSVSILRGLQFGMLDEDNDGEVSLGDITRAVFRKAPDRDLTRIRRFLEVWLITKSQPPPSHAESKQCLILIPAWINFTIQLPLV